MIAFEPRISGIGSNHSTNCATTTARPSSKVSSVMKGCCHITIMRLANIVHNQCFGQQDLFVGLAQSLANPFESHKNTFC